MTHRTRHIQTRAPVESFRFPILFPDSAPDPLLALLDSAKSQTSTSVWALTGSLR